MSGVEYPECDQDGLHECPVDGCDFQRHSLLRIEFHVLNEHRERHEDGR